MVRIPRNSAFQSHAQTADSDYAGPDLAVDGMLSR